MSLPRHRDEQGFTLIEILVVILILGILAAIALPQFLGQTEAAKDAEAKALSRNLETQVESCFIEKGEYDRCDDEAELPKTQFAWGNDPGEVDVLVNPVPGYEVAFIATSKTESYFAIARKTGSRQKEKYCVVPSGKYPSGGCRSGGPIPGFGTWR